MRITARSGIPCSHCSQAAIAVLGNNALVEVELHNATTALCRSHASWLPAAQLAKALKPTKKQRRASARREEQISA